MDGWEWWLPLVVMRGPMVLGQPFIMEARRDSRKSSVCSPFPPLPFPHFTPLH